MTLAAPKMPSNLCGKEKLRVSGTVIRCFFASATCAHAATHLRHRIPHLLDDVQNCTLISKQAKLPHREQLQPLRSRRCPPLSVRRPQLP